MITWDFVAASFAIFLAVIYLPNAVIKYFNVPEAYSTHVSALVILVSYMAIVNFWQQKSARR